MTPHVLDRLTFWVGGDLDAAETASVERHLSQCPACRAEAEHLRTSHAWLREAMASPFDVADGEQLRQRVMAQLPAIAQPARRLPLRPTLMAAAALLVAALVWRQNAGPAPLPTPSGQEAPPESTPVPPPTKPPRLAALPRPAAHPRPRSHPVPPIQDAPARIEFQTADPSIRIIWLAQSKPLPDTTPSTEEKS